MIDDAWNIGVVTSRALPNVTVGSENLSVQKKRVTRITSCGGYRKSSKSSKSSKGTVFLSHYTIHEPMDYVGVIRSGNGEKASGFRKRRTCGHGQPEAEHVALCLSDAVIVKSVPFFFLCMRTPQPIWEIERMYTVPISFTCIQIDWFIALSDE